MVSMKQTLLMKILYIICRLGKSGFLSSGRRMIVSGMKYSLFQSQLHFCLWQLIHMYSGGRDFLQSNQVLQWSQQFLHHDLDQGFTTFTPLNTYPHIESYGICFASLIKCK